MASVTTKLPTPQLETGAAVHLFDDGFDPIETGLREQVRTFIEALIRGELDAALARPRATRDRSSPRTVHRRAWPVTGMAAGRAR